MHTDGCYKMEQSGGHPSNWRSNGGKLNKYPTFEQWLPDGFVTKIPQNVNKHSTTNGFYTKNLLHEKKNNQQFAANTNPGTKKNDNNSSDIQSDIISKFANNKRFDVSSFRTSDDDHHIFLQFILAVEHHSLHRIDMKNTPDHLSHIIQKIVGNVPSIGIRLFNSICPYCSYQVDPKINELHDYNVVIYNQLADSLLDLPGHRGNTNILFTSGIIGRKNWPMLSLYMLCYRLDILFTLPFISNNKSENIVHLIASMIFSRYNSFYVGNILADEFELCNKYGHNNIYLVAMCAKLFGVFPIMPHGDLRKFMIKCDDDVYWIIPSMSLQSIDKLLNTFDQVPIAYDGSELLHSRATLTHKKLFDELLTDALASHHIQHLQMCSREFIYYLGMNKLVYYDYRDNLLSAKHIYKLQYVAKTVANLLTKSSRCYTHDTWPLVTNRYGELVVAYYDLMGYFKINLGHDMLDDLINPKWSSTSTAQALSPNECSIYNSKYSIHDLLFRDLKYIDTSNDCACQCGASSMNRDYGDSELFDTKRHFGMVKKLSIDGKIYDRLKSHASKYSDSPMMVTIAESQYDMLGDLKNKPDLVCAKNNNTCIKSVIPKLYTDVVNS